MKLDRFWVALGRDCDTKKSRLMQEADAAFYSDNRTRSLDAIEKLYEIFDQEYAED